MHELFEITAEEQIYIFGVVLFSCLSFLMIYFMHEMRKKERELYHYIDKRLSSHGVAISNAIEANHIKRDSILSDEELQMLLTPGNKEDAIPIVKESTVREEDERIIEELLSEILSC